MRADEVATPAGCIWRARACYPLAHVHGAQRVAAALAWDGRGLALAAREPRAADVARERWMFLDLESTGLGTGPGVRAFLVGIGRMAADGFHVEQYLMRDVGDEPALLHAVGAALETAGGLVTFNGKAFDVPLLTTRYALARRPAPHAGLPHCDVLHAARRLWAHRTRDRRLATLEDEIVGHRRRGDVAGALVPTLYHDYLRTGAGGLLDAVLQHNRSDLLSLLVLASEVTRFLARAEAGAPAARAARPTREVVAADRLRAARVLLAAGDAEGARALLERIVAADVAGGVRVPALLLLAGVCKRAGRLDDACSLWRDAVHADPRQASAYEELAKAEEHARRDAGAALAWVERAHRALASDDPARPALAHRRARLERKLHAHRPLAAELPEATHRGGTQQGTGLRP